MTDTKLLLDEVCQEYFGLSPTPAQPDHIVDASGMVDHSELVKRLRYYATRGMDAYVVAADCDKAADALEAIADVVARLRDRV